MIKLVVSDMDGTLLNTEKRLPSDFEQTYKSLQEQGIQFVVASGRPYYFLVPQFENFDHNIVFIGENGSIIASKDKHEIISSFPQTGIENIVKQGLNLPYADMIVCTPDQPYTNSKNQSFITEAKKYYPTLKYIEHPELITDKVLKFAINDTREGNVDKLEAWSIFQKDFVVEMSGDVWIDIMPKGVNKGSALKVLQDNWGITKEETMVFGDFHNDIEMLKLGKYNYAMQNAHEDVKQIASYIAPSNDDNGVMKVIHEIILNNRIQSLTRQQ